MRFETTGSGKGCKPRPVDRKKWDAFWDRYEKAKIKRAREGFKKEGGQWNRLGRKS